MTNKTPITLSQWCRMVQNEISPEKMEEACARLVPEEQGNPAMPYLRTAAQIAVTDDHKNNSHPFEVLLRTHYKNNLPSQTLLFLKNPLLGLLFSRPDIQFPKDNIFFLEACVTKFSEDDAYFSHFVRLFKESRQKLNTVFLVQDIYRIAERDNKQILRFLLSQDIFSKQNGGDPYFSDLFKFCLEKGLYECALIALEELNPSGLHLNDIADRDGRLSALDHVFSIASSDIQNVIFTKISKARLGVVSTPYLYERKIEEERTWLAQGLAAKNYSLKKRTL